MKITDIVVHKEIEDGMTFLVCRVYLEDGTQRIASAPWHNRGGLWHSNTDERAPEEIAGWLRQFAAEIDRTIADRAA